MVSLDTLYRAQGQATKVVTTPAFPCYSKQYVQSENGIKGHALRAYTTAYDGASFVGRKIDQITCALRQGFKGVLAKNDHALEKFLTSIQEKMDACLDIVYPVNIINGKRHLLSMPRSAEKFFGDSIVYPLITLNLHPTIAQLPNDTVSMATRVNRVVERLQAADTNGLLNPEDAPDNQKFNYRALTVRSEQMNAFAVPAGGMVVYSKLVEEINDAIRNNRFPTCQVQFADGSVATVDLSGVTLDDALAALLGHEMTHVASRHSISSIASQLLINLLMQIAKMLSVAYLKSKDQEYQQLIGPGTKNAAQRARLEEKERFYAKLDDVFSFLSKKVQNLINLLITRTNEYEADATGTCLAHQAGYNPLGALLLQEVLHANQSETMQKIHKHFEFLFSHPYAERRKRANFAVIQEIAPQLIQVQKWDHTAAARYDIPRNKTAIQYAHKITGQLKE